jgi:hypothetical protein
MIEVGYQFGDSVTPGTGLHEGKLLIEFRGTAYLTEEDQDAAPEGLAVQVVPAGEPVPVDGEVTEADGAIRLDGTWLVPALVICRLTGRQFDTYMEERKIVFSARMVQS